MKTLYINTVTPQTTIALYEEEQVLTEHRWPSEQNEAEKLQPGVQKLLNDQNLSIDDISRLVVCIGPGGFTSARIGVSAVNAWAFAKNIPVAQITVFDLYQHPETIIIVSSNSHEGWVKLPHQEPAYLRLEDFKPPPQFSFAGLLHEGWRQHLEKHGGTCIELPELLAKLNQLEFQPGIVKPWYYKDANITWSKKHGPVHRLDPDR
jgi:hypothetical protein